MKWHWKVRIYNNREDYGIGQIAFDRKLELIDSFMDSYVAMTGARILLEGMSEHPFKGVRELHEVFHILWTDKTI